MGSGYLVRGQCRGLWSLGATGCGGAVLSADNDRPVVECGCNFSFLILIITITRIMSTTATINSIDHFAKRISRLIIWFCGMDTR